MKKLRLLLLFIFILSVNTFSQKKLIFDTDFGADADDLGALAMLHHFIDREECELLAIISWQTEMYAVSAIDAVNRFYGHPDIPIGARKPVSDYINWHYSKSIADNFQYKLNHKSVSDAVTLYREKLSKSPDSSVTIVTVGPLKNIQDLLQSQGDSISDLDGKALINKKVKEFVIMGGKFPSGDWEWNFNGDMKGVTKYVIQNIEVPIVFSGFELGVEIKSGEIFNEIDKNSPLYIGFLHFSENAPWIKENFKGKILNNSTFDQTAVLYAVRNGVGTYWNKVENGICVPDDNGGNKWLEKTNSKHSYLTIKLDKEELSKLIESIMLGEF